MDRHRSITVIATALVLAACAGFYEPPVAGPTQTAPAGTTGPSTSAGPGTPAPTSSTHPAAERTAWENATAGITRDGQVPLQTALEAFSVVYGALPGVQMPQGDDAFTGSGTGAVRWLLGHWQELTEEQKTAASQIFDPNVPPPGAGAGAPIAYAGSQPLGPRRAPLGASLDTFKALAQTLATEISAKLPGGRKLKLPVDVVFRDLPVRTDRTGAQIIVYAQAVPIDTTGSPATGASQTEQSCLIQVNTRGQQLEDSDDQRALIAHELFHCFQFELASRVGDIFGIPPWIDEAGAAWVGEQFTSSDIGSTLGQQFWVGWLKEPDFVLFQRDYDAIGWYAHLARANVDPWKFLDKLYLTMLKTHSSFDAYDVAMKAGGDKAVDNWGPSYFRDDAVGGDWTMAGKGLPAYVKWPVVSGDLVADDPVTIYMVPMLAWALKMNVKADVFAFVGPSARGMVRFSDGTSRPLGNALGQAFCIKPGGCTCPDGSAGSAFAFQNVAPGEVWVGFTGHTDGMDIDIEAFSLPDTCEKSPQDLHVPEPCYCGGSLPDMFAQGERTDYFAPDWR